MRLKTSQWHGIKSDTYSCHHRPQSSLCRLWPGPLPPEIPHHSRRMSTHCHKSGRCWGNPEEGCRNTKIILEIGNICTASSGHFHEIHWHKTDWDRLTTRWEIRYFTCIKLMDGLTCIKPFLFSSATSITALCLRFDLLSCHTFWYIWFNLHSIHLIELAIKAVVIF